MGHSFSVKGTLFVLLSAIGYAFLPIFTRLIYQYETLKPLEVTAWRFIIAVICTWGLVIVTRQFRPMPLRQVRTIGSMGVLFSSAAILASFALERVPATTYTLLIYTYPAMVAIFSFILGELLGLQKWASIGLALFGCILTISAPIEFASPLNLSLPLLNAANYALYLVVAQRIKRPSGLLTGAISMSGTLLVCLAAASISGLSLPATREGWLALIGLGTIATFVPIVLMLIGISLVGATHASILSTIEPVATIILAALWLEETINFQQMLGGLLIIVSVLLLHVPFTRIPYINSRT